jgi:hypothetical protein
LVGDYLIASRLDPVQTDRPGGGGLCRAGEKLVVVGDGRDRAELAASGDPQCHLFGLAAAASGARRTAAALSCLSVSGLEDFGIAPVEALSACLPGDRFCRGAWSTPSSLGKTGELFLEQRAESLQEALRLFDWQAYAPEECRSAGRTLRARRRSGTSCWRTWTPCWSLSDV